MVQAVVFDAYGTLYDVHSVIQRCESFFPGKGIQLSQLWRAKQLEYTWQRSLMQRYAAMETLMSEYLALATYPDVAETLQKLRGKKQMILSNGSPDMLDPVVRHSGLHFDAC